MRIAFVTPEFVTEYSTGGGLGNYLHRMVKLCRERSHEVDVFVTSKNEATTFWYEGIRVHRVPPANELLSIRMRYRLSRTLGLKGLGCDTDYWAKCKGLARAIDREESRLPYDLIQSADYCGVGAAIHSRRDRVHVVRSSGMEDLNAKWDSDHSVSRRALVRIWELSLRHADRVYAPSQLCADHISKTIGLNVDVIRPPAWIEVESGESTVALPNRFAIHFGQLRKLKGTEAIARALPLVWRAEPSFRMLWIGPIKSHDRDEWTAIWGDKGGRVEILDPMDKPQLYAIVDRAEFAVLPSYVDNLPNTAIECMLKGVPVIGFKGGSIDELVVPGEMGDLVPTDNIEALARSMISAWRGESTIRRGFSWDTAVARQMIPDAAVDALISLARLKR